MTDYNVVNLTCGGCGNPLATNQKKCQFCGGPVLITSFNSVYSMTQQQATKYANSFKNALKENPNNASLNFSVALCYLKLKLFDQALKAFEKAIEDNFDNSETYFYAGICLLKGKKAFLSVRADIDKILEYLQAAITIEPRAIYYYFQAYVKYDYFHRKHFEISPTYVELLDNAKAIGLPDLDVQSFYSMAGVDKPDGM